LLARGYDFGWSDTPYRDAKGILQVKPGWVTKLHISNRRRFHDFRDTAATHLLSGTWGTRWSLEDVSEFLGHSDIKVTRDRYAAITTEAKTRLAAGVQPCRLSNEQTPQHPQPETVASPLVVRSLSADAWITPDLTTRNHLAPELGLEPRTIRLTVERSTN